MKAPKYKNSDQPNIFLHIEN